MVSSTLDLSAQSSKGRILSYLKQLLERECVPGTGAVLQNRGNDLEHDQFESGLSERYTYHVILGGQSTLCHRSGVREA